MENAFDKQIRKAMAVNKQGHEMQRTNTENKCGM
jgi:hypothetical protein